MDTKQFLKSHRNKNVVLVIGIIFLLYILRAHPVQAAMQELTAAPPRLADLSSLLVRAVDLIYAFGGIIFLALAIMIGFQWMSSQGDDEVLGELKNRLTYWVIAFVLFFLSTVIVSAIYDVFQVKNCRGEPVRPGFNLIYEGSCTIVCECPKNTPLEGEKVSIPAIKARNANPPENIDCNTNEAKTYLTEKCKK
jgi:hypothetical protein